VIRSMTGFAAVSREQEGERVNVTVKSVNHRFLDVQIKAPQALSAMDGRLRALIQRKLTRGRVEVSLGLERTAPLPRDIVLDEALLNQFVQVVESARARGLVSGQLTASDLLRIPQALEIRPRTEQAGVSEGLGGLIEGVLEDALDALVVMRTTEGRFLSADLDGRLMTISTFTDELEAAAAMGQEDLTARLRERLAGLPSDLAGDPTALAQEVVRFVARSDVAEEIVRMRSHLEHWRTLAAGEEPCGRKLDFLLQEMNREINTLGSKADGGKATETVIAAKAELERLREQVQNVE
jgi:uncharacterized protein (TIGR00255 family)